MTREYAASQRPPNEKAEQREPYDELKNSYHGGGFAADCTDTTDNQGNPADRQASVTSNPEVPICDRVRIEINEKLNQCRTGNRGGSDPADNSFFVSH